MAVYNPVEVKIRMKKIDARGNTYFIGNSDMDISLLDTVIKFYPPQEGEKSGALVINNTKERQTPDDQYDDQDDR